MKVSLEEMLMARDRRAKAQREMLESVKHNCALVSFTLNIPGDVKSTPLTRMLFNRGLEELRQIINPESVIKQSIIREKTGSEALILIGDKDDSLENNHDRLAQEIKEKLERVEESFPAARLFDFDVLNSAGEKLSRRVPRRCLLCDQPAHACARSRAHGLEAVMSKVRELLVDFCVETLGEMGRKALEMEIHTTPKPGLVDENNNGAHRDMDLPLFEKSIDAISPYLKEAAMIGLNSGCESCENSVVMNRLKIKGIEAEEKMLQATGGVNTHKGIIYSMGLLLYGMGRSLVTGEDPIAAASNLAEVDAYRRLSDRMSMQNTNGSKVYSKYGAKGAVEEATSGFPAALYCKKRLKIHLKSRYKKVAGSLALCDLMAWMEDTNILHRGGREGLEYVQRKASGISAIIYNLSEEEAVRALVCFDDELIKRNLSPGGSADMLALAYLLLMWEECQ